MASTAGKKINKKKATTKAATKAAPTATKKTLVKASGRLPAWAATPMKKKWVLERRSMAMVYTEDIYKTWRKEVNAAKKK